MSNNEKIFNRIWNKIQPYGLSFISSNGGTGKTVTFKFYLIRDALKRGIHFHIFCRFGNARETTAQAFLDVKPTYSNRQRKLLSQLSIEKNGEKFIYIIETKTKRRIAQVVDIFGQAFYKPFGNLINAQRAIFDEVLAENGDYCPDELNKFNRLINTMARNNKYQVICLYNNTSPNFPYFNYYKGKSYSTHVSDSGAYFVYFTAPAWSNNEALPNLHSVQSVIKRTDYNSVYSFNTFVRYPAFYCPADLRNAETVCKIEISTRIFKLRYLDGIVYLDARYARKRSAKMCFSVNRRDETTLPLLPLELRAALQQYIAAGAIKVPDINDTVFAKLFCEKI